MTGEPETGNKHAVIVSHNFEHLALYRRHRDLVIWAQFPFRHSQTGKYASTGTYLLRMLVSSILGIIHSGPKGYARRQMGEGVHLFA